MAHTRPQPTDAGTTGARTTGTTKPPRRRARRTTATVAAAIVAALALAGCLSTYQQREMTLVNDSRTTNRLATLRSDQAAMDKAQAWSAHMAATGVMEHTGGGGQITTTGLSNWCRVDENVGTGASIEWVHQAFLASPRHRANMLGSYDRVGVGVVHRDNRVWVTQIYLRSC